jgi:fatty acid desaturase
MVNSNLGELNGIQLFLLIGAFIIIGIIFAYFLWSLFVILMVIGGFAILHEFLHFLRND